MLDLLKRYLRPHRQAVTIVIILLFVQAGTNLFLPSLNADIINDGVVTGDIAEIWRLGGIMLLVSMAQGIAAIATVYYAARIGMRIGREMRRDVFTRVESFSIRQLHDFTVPSLITRNTNDVQQVQMLIVMALTMMLLAPIMAVGAVIMAIREDATLSLLLVVIIPVMLVTVGLIVLKAIPLFRAMQTKIDRVNQVLRENLTGIRVIRAFNRTPWEEARFGEANDDLTLTALRVTRLFALTFPIVMLIMNMSSVAIMWFGGHRIADGEMPIGNLTAFLSYIMLLLMSVMMSVMTLMMVPRASASADRIKAVLDTTPEIEFDTAVRVASTSAPAGLVELSGVQFRYPGASEPVLDGIDLVCAPGTTTAVVGGTGSGKTTLINLLPRLVDVSEGSVSIGGLDVREQPPELLWSRFGFVPQKAFLFSGTVRSNLEFGRPQATDEQMWTALEIAQAAGFVRELPEGLDAPVEQGGANFSGGQRQRLSIARAIVRDPAVLVLDDSFSALDYATDARLRRALREHMAGATVIVVAQRIASITHADQIVVLEDGRIVGRGTHDELIATSETYREILASQAEANA